MKDIDEALARIRELEAEVEELRAIAGAARVLEKEARESYGPKLGRLDELRALLRPARADCAACGGAGWVVVRARGHGRQYPILHPCDCTTFRSPGADARPPNLATEEQPSSFLVRELANTRHILAALVQRGGGEVVVTGADIERARGELVVDAGDDLVRSVLRIRLVPDQPPRLRLVPSEDR